MLFRENMRLPHRIRILVFSCLLIIAGSRNSVRAQNNQLEQTSDTRFSEIAREFSSMFPKHHISRKKMDDAISSMAWSNYISALDYERVYFLASDIETFRKNEFLIDDQFKEGDVNFAFEVYDVFKKRLADRHAYVDSLLANGFDLEKQESFKWKRKDAEWAKDKKEWDDLWRKKIKNEYVRLVVADKLTEQEEPAETNAPSTNGAPVEVKSPEELIGNRYKQSAILTADTDSESVFERYLTAAAMAYDPHSTYMAPYSVENFQIEMSLSLCGIGVVLSPDDGAVKVESIIPGGPADRDKREKRLVPGDRIVGVGQGDGENVSIRHLPLDKAVTHIRGEKGTKVVLKVHPAGEPTKFRYVDLMRDEVKLEQQAAQSEIRSVQIGTSNTTYSVGIISLPAFYANMQTNDESDPLYRSSANDVAKILKEMTEKNVDGVILDLRQNGGGSLIEAVRMTGLFIDSGPVVQIKERFWPQVLFDDDPSMAYEGPLVILVSRLSASASEILAGALQDYGRAIIVGDTHTHGKGTVQSISQLGEDDTLGAARITTSIYYRISGDSTQIQGVSSDIVVPSPYGYMQIGEDTFPNPVQWSPIKPARFLAMQKMDDIISALNEKSRLRKENDQKFANYRQLLERIGSIDKTERLPLDLESRMKFARTEKELLKLQTELLKVEQEKIGSEEKAEADVALGEAINIMTDYIKLTKNPAEPSLPVAGLE